MADISQITLPSGTTYNLKDAQARSDIQNIRTITSSVMSWGGTTSTAITDGATTSTITIGSSTLNLGSDDAGLVVAYNNKEYAWNGSAWQEFGSTGSLKALAFKDSATYTPSGSVSSTFTGASSNVTITATDDASGNYQPAGQVTVSTNATSSETVSITSTGTFTPAGDISFTNANQTALVSAAVSGDATYTPAGSVDAPSISLSSAGSTTSINNPTANQVATAVLAAAPGATAPSNSLTYYAVSGEVLSLYQLGFSLGASISTTSVDVKTGDASYQASAPTFTGTGARLVTGNISVPSSATFSGTQGSVSVSGSDTVSVPSTFTATFTGQKTQLSGTTTAAGSVSSTFTGTEGTAS